MAKKKKKKKPAVNVSDCDILTQFKSRSCYTHSLTRSRTHAAKLNSHVPHKPDNWKWFPAMQWKNKKKNAT